MNEHVKFHGNWINYEHVTKRIAQHVIFASCSNNQAQSRTQQCKNYEINAKKH